MHAAAADSMARMGLFAFPLAVGCYFLPCIIGAIRNTNKGTGILLLNLFLGWTGLGWLIALIWACSAETKDQAMLREIAYRHMATMPANQPIPVQASNAEFAGRTLGKAVGFFRKSDVPPSITQR